MESEKKMCNCCGHDGEGKCEHRCKHKCKGKGGMCSGVYGLAFVGALVYFIQTATSFWAGVLGVVKAIFWPALLIHKLLGFLGM